MKAQPPRRASDLKTETSIVITLQTNTCYREQKFPAGHKESACHVGLTELRHDVCSHCTWFGEVKKQQVAKLTGAHLIAMTDYMKKLRDEGVPGVAPEPKKTTLLDRVRSFLREFGI